MNTRRNFLKAIALAAASAPVVPAVLSATRKTAVVSYKVEPALDEIYTRFLLDGEVTLRVIAPSGTMAIKMWCDDKGQIVSEIVPA